MIATALDFILGFILEKIFGIQKEKIERFLSKRKNRKIDTLSQKRLERNLGAFDSFYCLDNGIPYYNKELIKVIKGTDNLILAVPDGFHHVFNYEKDGNPNIRKEIVDWNQIKKTFEYFGLGQNYIEIIKDAKEEVAKELELLLEDGVTRFNGYMYGVKKFMANREGDDEIQSLTIELYETDFYTWRVFSRIYNKNRGKIQIEDIRTVNNYLTPFLSSMGVSGIFIFDRGNGDEILLSRRSQYVSVDKGKIHMTIEEVFSRPDYKPEIGNPPSIETCLKRALSEEMHINEVLANRIIKQYEFLNVGIDIEKLELEFSSLVRIEFPEDFGYSDLITNASIARDGILERDKDQPFETLLVKDIEQFLDKNKDEISVLCKAQLIALNIRSKYGRII